MLNLDIPGYGKLHIEHLVADYNGTLAVDGRLLPGVKVALTTIAKQVTVHVITADTFGLAAEALQGLNCQLILLGPGNQATAKRRYIQQLGAQKTIALGNGRNDRLMLSTAAVGITVLLAEGAASQTILNADVVVPGILPALAFFQEPRRLIATLRS